MSEESYKIYVLEECDTIYNDAHPSFSLDNLQWISEKGGNSCRRSAFCNADHDGDDDDGGHDGGCHVGGYDDGYQDD